MKKLTISLSILMSIGLICYILNIFFARVIMPSLNLDAFTIEYFVFPISLGLQSMAYGSSAPVLYFCKNSAASGIANCPMNVIKHIIVRTTEFVSNEDAPLQMQIIRRIMEDIYGGNWGVLIIKEPELISTVIHWTFPDHRHRDGSAAFCLHVERGWQYNVFKTGDIDTDDRLTVEK
uniref:Inner membrane protein n=1 Tax=Globodera pallida TaxID=36090 RepID=A0A183CPQ7_GLOPA